MAFSATLVSQGLGAGIIVATGDNTEIGTINKLVNSAKLERDNFGCIALALLATMAIVGFHQSAA
jgi:magnesium-transporting ATPase (P-type)